MSNVLSGTRVLAVIALSVCATAVLPPAGAWWLNARRVATTTERAAAAATRERAVPGRGVVCGPGRLPEFDAGRASATHAAWVSTAVVNPSAFAPGMPTDAWGQCFLMNDRWVLSAGPNGVVDTALDAAAPGGDDIGAVLK